MSPGKVSLVTGSLPTRPRPGREWTGSSLGASDTKSYVGAESTTCNSSGAASVSSLLTTGAGASQEDASWLAFCASASQGLVVVENQVFALLGGAASGAGLA